MVVNTPERSMGDGSNVIEFTGVVGVAGQTFDLPGKYHDIRIQNLGSETIIVTVPPYIRYRIAPGKTQHYEKVSADSVIIRSASGESQGFWMHATRYGPLLYTVPPPAIGDFNWAAMPVPVLTDGNGHYDTAYDISVNAPTGKIYYVNGTTGLDTNSGLTEALAFKTLNKAVTTADSVEIRVTDGIYNRVGAFSGTAVTRSGSLAIIATGGNVRVINCSPQTWAFHNQATYPYLYKTTATGGKQVFDDLYHDAFDDMLEYTPVGTAQECNDTPGTCFISGTTTYIRTVDGRVPDDSIMVLKDQLSAQFNDGTFYFEGISFEGGFNGAVRVEKISTAPKAYFKNCKFKYATNDAGSPGGVSIVGAAESFFQGCEAARNINDGFNYHVKTATLPNAIEINCLGRDNGKDDDIDNGSTQHDGGKAFRLNCYYRGNKGSNLGDTFPGTQSWNVGILSGESTARDEKRYNSNYTAHVGAKVILEGCESRGSLNSFTVEDTSTMIFRGFVSNGIGRTIEGSGRIKNY